MEGKGEVLCGGQVVLHTSHDAPGGPPPLKDLAAHQSASCIARLPLSRPGPDLFTGNPH